MKRMAPWLITILLAITLIALASFLLINNSLNKNNSETAGKETKKTMISADKIVEETSEITDIKTNLADSNYIISISLAFQLDSKKSKEEFEKIKEIKVKPLIIKTLADTKPEELNGANGKDQFSNKLLNLVNKTLPSGKLTQIDITNFILSPL
ncbi:flagellar basal body-associated FliL family protein [Paenibacillus sediminis]|nr:flagellar basal body-associated FliL family protein [Paenibacillus sediminis]